MTKDEIKEKYDSAIDSVKTSDAFDASAKAIMVTALNDKRKTEERALEAKETRAFDKLFIAHYANGCPECSHTYRPSKQEVSDYIAMREVSNIKL